MKNTNHKYVLLLSRLHIFIVAEIDFFAGRHAGLILAEVELNSSDEQIILPEWISKEVSHDSRYFNSNLVKQNFGQRDKR